MIYWLNLYFTWVGPKVPSWSLRVLYHLRVLNLYQIISLFQLCQAFFVSLKIVPNFRCFDIKSFQDPTVMLFNNFITIMFTKPQNHHSQNATIISIVARFSPSSSSSILHPYINHHNLSSKPTKSAKFGARAPKGGGEWMNGMDGRGWVIGTLWSVFGSKMVISPLPLYPIGGSRYHQITHQIGKDDDRPPLSRLSSPSSSDRSNLILPRFCWSRSPPDQTSRTFVPSAVLLYYSIPVTVHPTVHHRSPPNAKSGRQHPHRQHHCPHHRRPSSRCRSPICSSISPPDV